MSWEDKELKRNNAGEIVPQTYDADLDDWVIDETPMKTQLTGSNVVIFSGKTVEELEPNQFEVIGIYNVKGVNKIRFGLNRSNSASADTVVIRVQSLASNTDSAPNRIHREEIEMINKSELVNSEMIGEKEFDVIGDWIRVTVFNSGDRSNDYRAITARGIL